MFSSRLDKRQFIRFLSFVYASSSALALALAVVFFFCSLATALALALTMALVVASTMALVVALTVADHADCDAFITFYQAHSKSKIQIPYKNTHTRPIDHSYTAMRLIFFSLYLLLLSSRWRNTFTSTRTLRFSFALALAFKQIKYITTMKTANE